MSNAWALGLFCLGLTVAGSEARAQDTLSGFDFKAVLSFDPGRAVTVSGGALGLLLAELFGPEAQTGAVSLSGRITYDTSAPLTASEAGTAGYRTAIQAASLDIGAVTVSLDRDLLNANAASSKIGLSVPGGGGWCVDAEHCALVGMPPVAWGSVVIVQDDADHVMQDETGLTTFSKNDAIGFLMGRTDAVGEFAPAFATPSFGTVSVDGMAAGIFANGTGSFFEGLALHPIKLLEGTPHIGRTEVWIYLEGPQLTDKVKIEGVITEIAIQP